MDFKNVNPDGGNSIIRNIDSMDFFLLKIAKIKLKNTVQSFFFMKMP
jgi:hypothetical protein